MELGAVTPNTAAPYGHACAECARAKCKCILRSGSSTCQRCHRLERKCAPATQIRKRGGLRKTTGTRRGQLEDKLDNLVTLLQVQNARQTVDAKADSDANQKRSTEPVHPESPQFLPRNFASVWAPTEKSYEAPSKAGAMHSPWEATTESIIAPTLTSRSNAPATPSSISDFIELDADAESNLQTFRTVHLQFYPLVHIPAELTAQECRRKWPFLWSNITAICARSMDVQCELGVQIREYLARRIVVEGGRSIDLLLGLLVHLSWTHHFARSGSKSYMGILSNMARSLLWDLGLDNLDGNASAPAFTPEIDALRKARPAGQSSRSDEERRALLACYVMSASVSAFLNYECLRWSPEMERSACHLHLNPECPEDEVLVAIARISQVSSNAAKVIRRSDEETGSQAIHIRPLQAALDKVKSSLSPHLLSNKVVLSYIYNAETMLYEIALITDLSTSFDGTFSFRRPQYLHACLEASKAGVENHLSYNVTHYIGISFYPLMHCMHALQILHRLSLLDDAGWDAVAVRRSAGVVTYLRQLSCYMENVHVYFSTQTGIEDNVWLKAAQKLTLVLPKWSAGLEDPSMRNENETFADLSLPELADDSWITNFFSTAAWNV